MSTPTVSVVLPAYNEAEHIVDNVKEVVEFLKTLSFEYEVVVVDDGSPDRTYEHAVKLLDDGEVGKRVRIIRYDVNRGKGHALVCGAQAATGEMIVFLDSDMDLHPRQLSHFFRTMEETGAAAVIGCKLHPQSKVNYPASRRIVSYGYYLLTKLLFGLPVRDTQTGIKVFKRQVLADVIPRILVKRFAFDIELLVNAHHLGYKIVEAPVHLHFQRKFGRIHFSDVVNIFTDTLAIFYRLNIIRYYDRFERGSGLDTAPSTEISEYSLASRFAP
jgi:glycosyltransferase involved in cell wall biosynthesis